MCYDQETFFTYLAAASLVGAWLLMMVCAIIFRIQDRWFARKHPLGVEVIELKDFGR